MTPEQRLIRLEVGSEIIEAVILDFLEEHSGESFTTARVSRTLEMNFSLCHGTLQNLYWQGRIGNSRKKPTQPNRWQDK